MNIKLIAIGKTDNKALQTLIDDYQKRLSFYIKFDLEIISTKILKYPGTGHGDVFYDKKGNMYYVFHTHFSETEVAPRKSAIVPISLKNGKLQIQKGKSMFWLVTN